MDKATLRRAAEELWAAADDVSLAVENPPDDLDDRLATAQSFLRSARSTVEATLASLRRVRRLRRTANDKAPQGQLAEQDVDLLRTAVLFAGAGLEAALKRAVEDAVPDLVDCNDQAARKLTAWTKQHLQLSDGGIDPKALSSILLSDKETPRRAVVDAYADDLIQGSAQSTDRVEAIASALGVSSKSLFKRINGAALRDAFVARNEIAHELDLQEEAQPGHFGQKRHRQLAKTTTLVTELLSVAQLVLNETHTNLQAD